MEKSNWKGKKVLVTGAGGFIGSHLVEHLVELGADVRALVRYNSLGRWGWLEESTVRDDIDVLLGDVTDRDSAQKAIKKQEIVFHLAALIGIPYSYQAAFSYAQTNITGTLNILQAAKEEGVRVLVHTSTSETYGSAQYVPIDEKHPVVAQSPYAATKAAADQLAVSFYRSFGVPVKIARPFNTYGPRQSGRAIIPTIITQVLSGNKKLELGNIFPSRDFTYVKDVVYAFTEIAQSGNFFGEVTNIGSNSEISIDALARLIASLLDVKITIIRKPSRTRPKNSEVERLCCDNTKLLENTDWKIRYSLEKGLLETIRWVKKNLSLYKAKAYNV